ncbi:DNA (cytosine-5)-methyltransferase PliMCI-like isoform X2 [Ischnura elegans]|uniref:DNA (cytosine-5)-methyltransferase PliMCI-like isoform X2 n=1 Tax=Ischnura elegans TaxID=197161 RepID=UPI001ED8962C|nr:DNA (cytosine-5)-methyltransferase PliMCI-like isoform X2 [Ischnura elegans]
MPTRTVKSADIPADIAKRLEQVHNDFLEGDLTKKGYFKKKWVLLKDIISKQLCEKVDEITKRFDAGEVPGDQYYDQVLQILDEACSTPAPAAASALNGDKSSQDSLPVDSNNQSSEGITGNSSDVGVKDTDEPISNESAPRRSRGRPRSSSVKEPSVSNDSSSKEESNRASDQSSDKKDLKSDTDANDVAMKDSESTTSNANEAKKLRGRARSSSAKETSISSDSGKKEESNGSTDTQSLKEKATQGDNDSNVMETKDSDVTDSDEVPPKRSRGRPRLSSSKETSSSNDSKKKDLNGSMNAVSSPASVKKNQSETVDDADVEMSNLDEQNDDDCSSPRVPSRRQSRFSTPKDSPKSADVKEKEDSIGKSPRRSLKKVKSPPLKKDQATITSMFAKNPAKPGAAIKIEKNEESKESLDNNAMDTSESGAKFDADDEKDISEMEESIEKKPKLKDESCTEHRASPKVGDVSMKEPPLRCSVCKQTLKDNPDLVLYGGHPKDAVDEEIALVDPRLSLFTGDEVGDIDSADERPQNKITCFSVFDQEGHLCPFDSGLIERNALLYFSGYIKAIYEENSDIEGGIPAKDIGPINEWWVSGYDGGESALIGFSTAFGEYILMRPSPEYAPFMAVVQEKIFMSKIVIEFLCGTRGNGGDTYEDLLNTLRTTVPPGNLPPLTEDSLLRHAQFICEQVHSFDSVDMSSSEGEGSSGMQESLLTAPCVRSLIKLAGVTFGKRRAMRRSERRDVCVKKQAQWTKATTTPLVKEVFEMFFREQIDLKAEGKENLVCKKRRCGICEACQQPDCGQCISCKDMVKFGGSGRSKQACIARKCPNMAIQEADDSEPEDEEKYQDMAEKNSRDETLPLEKTKRSHLSEIKKSVVWMGNHIFKNEMKTYYKKAVVEGVEGEIELGCYVLVQPSNPSTPYFVARVNSMWEDKNGRKMFHAVWYCRGSETVLGETADPCELFSIDECEDVSLRAIAKKTTVIKYVHPEDWATQGGTVDGPDVFKDVKHESNSGETLWFQKHYDKLYGRFLDLPEDPPCPKKGTEYRFCTSCERQYLSENKDIPKIDEKLDGENEKKEMLFGVVHHKGEEYRRGHFVFLNPTKVKLKSDFCCKQDKKKSKPKENQVDEEMYPEYYRKCSSSGDSEMNVKGSNLETPPPFIIGMISEIGAKQTLFSGDPRFVSASDIWLDVTLFYRPENTFRGPIATHQSDLNLLYWTKEKQRVGFKSVAGKCQVVYGENVESSGCAETSGPQKWTVCGPNRFYFMKEYDFETQSFIEPPAEARCIGKQSKGKGKGKGKGKKEAREESNEDRSAEWSPISNPLQSLDVFAGCGGLSEGLHQSGVAVSKWAIEKEESAAHAFRLNNPGCIVFSDDCNDLLRLVMDGKETNDSGQSLPQKGEVELLCGGPPCQGFSGMNRFNSRQYSLFKNSLIASYLSYCDYYRPRFFILENVRNFVSFKKSMVLKLTLRCLLRMGYQCSFGILQAGNYGVPQTRRRAIILAAAPGEILPKHPSPTHVFSPRACQLSIMVDEKRYDPDFSWNNSAPLRTITVRDAMSDLPEIRNGSKKEELSYGGEPFSHFQRQMRGNQDFPVLRDHICKEMAPLVEARMAHIPTASGSDWRDLPNIVVRLSDGSYTKKLLYTHHDKKNGRSANGSLRGVCSCATGKSSCDPMDRQFNTLIPWCLPHTGNRHNNWAGLYGRLEWDGFFSTTITNPEPMGKQGRVLHPEQTRVVSVRECARSQGFPDSYRFYGNILDKHRQVGNAVPPPVGAAIGYEIRKCVSLKEQKNNEKAKENDRN